MQELNWNNDNKQNLDFPVHYWNYIEKMFSQFATGEHIVTKAFEADNDYLGFTDDYDFCWGAEIEGQALAEGENEYTPDNGRLWGVYTKTAGEIYLLKANEDLTNWERHELLTFVPSGSRRASIEFNSDGHYEIAVEFIPAGSETYEIWLLSYPYKNIGIKKICDGTEPQLYIDNHQKMWLFHTDNEQYNVFYRKEDDNYNTGYLIDEIFTPERTLHFQQVLKSTKALNKKSKYIEQIVFYKRDDDYKPYKYIKRDIAVILEELEVNNDLGNINWIDMRYLVNVFGYYLSSGEALTDSSITFKANTGQEEKTQDLNSNGETSLRLIPYSTVYDVVLYSDSLGYENSWGILVDGYDSVKEMDINIPHLNSVNKFNENIILNNSLENMIWEAATYNLYLTTLNADMNIQSDVTVTFEGQRSQEEKSVISDVNGEASLDLLPYETPYNVNLSHPTLGEYDFEILVDNNDDTYSMNINLFYINPFEDEITSLNSNLRSIEWYYEDPTEYIYKSVIDTNSLGNNLNSILWVEV